MDALSAHIPVDQSGSMCILMTDLISHLVRAKTRVSPKLFWSISHKNYQFASEKMKQTIDEVNVYPLVTGLCMLTNAECEWVKQVGTYSPIYPLDVRFSLRQIITGIWSIFEVANR